MKLFTFFRFSILLVLCWLSLTTIALDKKGNSTEEEDGHSETEELLEHFFEKYGDKDGNISPEQLCNLTQKLTACNGNSAKLDDHGHEEAKTEEHLDDEEDHGEEHETEGEEEEEENEEVTM